MRSNQTKDKIKNTYKGTLRINLSFPFLFKEMKVIKNFKNKFDDAGLEEKQALLMKSIKQKCLECCGGVKKIAYKCEVTSCPLNKFNFLVEK